MKVLEFDRLDAFLELEIDGKEIKEVSEIPLIDAIPLDKAKKAIEKIEKLYEDFDGYDPQALGDYASHVYKILDKLITESEEK